MLLSKEATSKESNKQESKMMATMVSPSAWA
jgi:hypothetical protein